MFHSFHDTTSWHNPMSCVSPVSRSSLSQFFLISWKIFLLLWSVACFVGFVLLRKISLKLKFATLIWWCVHITDSRTTQNQMVIDISYISAANAWMNRKTRLIFILFCIWGWNPRLHFIVYIHLFILLRFVDKKEKREKICCFHFIKQTKHIFFLKSSW